MMGDLNCGDLRAGLVRHGWQQGTRNSCWALQGWPAAARRGGFGWVWLFDGNKGVC